MINKVIVTSFLNEWGGCHSSEMSASLEAKHKSNTLTAFFYPTQAIALDLTPRAENSEFYCAPWSLLNVQEFLWNTLQIWTILLWKEWISLFYSLSKSVDGNVQWEANFVQHISFHLCITKNLRDLIKTSLLNLKLVELKCSINRK